MLSVRVLFALAAWPLLLLLGVKQLGFGSVAPHVYALAEWIPAIQGLVFDQPRVSLRQGTVVGATLRDTLKNPVDAFRGIPYALPPTSDGRFRRAVAVNASDGVIDARGFGYRCPGKQLIPIKGDTGSSEDCLTVNVFRPHEVQGKLPVAIYVHGGAYNRGSALMHNTASMVGWSQEPFIGVSFNYRVGALGFLSSSTTAEEDVLNLGLHDQILLFQWVQDNIESFGGDPSQVTLFGLSAGAHSIAHHVMNTDLKEKYFHRAIIESGAATSRAVHFPDAKLHEAQFAEFVEAAGCTGSEDVLDCLRKQPSSTVTEASFTVFDRYNPSIRWAFQPVIDGNLIKRPQIEAWKSGKWNKIPLLTGFNTNEGSYYVPTKMSTSEEFTSFFHALLPAYSDADIQTIDSLYPDPAKYPSSPYLDTRPIPVGPQYKRVEAAYGHYAYACPVRQTAHFASAQEPPVFLYRWALNKTVQAGANHADQMPYETYNPEVREISAAQDEIAAKLHAYFTSFIVAGDPNVVSGVERAAWERYDASNGKIMVFGDGNDERAGGGGVGVAAEMREDEWSRTECEFWWTQAGLPES